MRPFGDSLCKYETNHSRSSGLSFTLDVRRVWSDLLLIPHDAQSHQGMRRDESGVPDRKHRQGKGSRERYIVNAVGFAQGRLTLNARSRSEPA